MIFFHGFALENNLKSYAISLIRQYYLYGLAMLALALGAGLLNVTVRYMIRSIIDTITTSQYDHIAYLLGLFAVYKLLHHLMYFMNRLLDVRYKPKLLVQIIADLYHRVMRHSLHWFDSNLSGDITSKISDFQAYTDQLISVSFRSCAGIFSMIISLIFLYQVHHLPTLLLGGFILIYSPIIYYLLQKQLRLQQHHTRARQAAIGVLTDSISNSFSIKVMGDYQTDSQMTLLPALHNWRDWERITRSFNAWWVDNTDTALITIMATGQLYALTHLYQSGSITAGGFAFSAMITLGIHRELDGIMDNLLMTINPAVAIMKTSFNFINQPYTITDKPYAHQLTPQKRPYRITYDNVIFKYSDQANTPNALDGINLTIDPGERLGVVGLSGSGKTSLVRALLRYRDVSSGAIKLDKWAITDITQASLRRAIAIVPQDITLFHRSILDNLRVANPTASNQMIIDTCKRARLHHVIQAMPDQYDTRVGERGVKLSGGQRQRLAIARAMLSNAPILILDEATSSLDSQTEQAIQQALDALLSQTSTTVIAIAHRLSTVAAMNRIIVMRHGRIVESGTHAHLLSQPDSAYKALWNAQATC